MAHRFPRRAWWLIGTLAALGAVFTLLRLSGVHSWGGYGIPVRGNDLALSAVVVERPWRGGVTLTHLPECFEIGGKPP